MYCFLTRVSSVTIMNIQATCSCNNRSKTNAEDSTMNQVLQHRELFGMLKQYAIKELSVENVLFYETYHSFMTLVKNSDVSNSSNNTQLLLQKAEEISKEYCNTNGTYALNINAEISIQVKSAVDSKSLEKIVAAFAAVKNAIEFVMIDTIKRFCKLDENYKKYMQQQQVVTTAGNSLGWSEKQQTSKITT